MILINLKVLWFTIIFVTVHCQGSVLRNSVEAEKKKIGWLSLPTVCSVNNSLLNEFFFKYSQRADVAVH